MSHNKDLKNLIKEVDEAAKIAKNNEELLASIQLVKDFNDPIKFDYTYHYICCVIGLLLVGGSSYWTFKLTPAPEPLQYALIALSTGVLIIPLIMMMLNSSSITDISDYIFHKDTLQDNNMEPMDLEDDLFEYLEENFQHEFDRGNYSRKFVKGYQTENEGKDCFLYKFKYVNKREVPYTTTDSKGNVRVGTRTVYDTYHRYGAVIDFDFVKSIEIKSDGSRINPVDYLPSSISFSDTFKVGAKNEIEASKFLKPAVVVAIEKLSDTLGDLNIEIDENGKMCISCTNSTLFNVDASRQHSIAETTEFYNEIAGFTELGKLNAVYDCIKKMKRYNDKNFT